jgi:hypothetical protein
MVGGRKERIRAKKKKKKNRAAAGEAEEAVIIGHLGPAHLQASPGGQPLLLLVLF